MDETQLDTDIGAVSDELLARRIRWADARAFEELYRRHQRALFWMALSVVADRRSAEDVVHDAFLKLWQRPDSYVPERGRLISWLLGIVHHRAVDCLRRQRSGLRCDAEYGSFDGQRTSPDAESGALAGLRRAAMGRALGTLPRAQGLVVEMIYVRGMSRVEIADLLGEPVSTVRSRLRLALQKLRLSPELAELI